MLAYLRYQNWSYEANSATFKAMREAGFNKANFPTLNDTMLVSEPEAASHFTARDLRERGTEFMNVSFTSFECCGPILSCYWIMAPVATIFTEDLIV